jgi:hypothetical protein
MTTPSKPRCESRHKGRMLVRKQKTDRRDAKHILQLLEEERFPRIWIPDTEMRDHRQLLTHRHKLVQIRTRVKNELQHLMLNQGMQKKQKLWSTEGRAALASLPLAPWTDRRRKDLLSSTMDNETTAVSLVQECFSNRESVGWADRYRQTRQDQRPRLVSLQGTTFGVCFATHRVHSLDVDRKEVEHAVHLVETLLSALKDKA